MSNRLTLKNIGLEKINRILNPNFETKFIYTLLFSGITLLVYQRVLLQIASSLEFLSGETYIKLSLNSGTDTILLILGGAMIIMSCTLYIIRHSKKEAGSLKDYKSLVDASEDIRPLMDDNRRIFMAFGPNSESGSTGDIRHDFEVWQECKQEQIVPNNEKILSLLNSVHTFKKHEEIIISDMKSHIQAFKTHCENPDFDYSDNQFPIVFSDLILGYCAQQPNKIEAYKEWLEIELNDIRHKVEAVYIFGSALYGQEKTDLDVIIKTLDTEVEEIRSLAQVFKGLKKSFHSQFNLHLHLKVYSELESGTYNDFMSKIAAVKRII